MGREGLTHRSNRLLGMQAADHRGHQSPGGADPGARADLPRRSGARQEHLRRRLLQGEKAGHGNHARRARGDEARLPMSMTANVYGEPVIELPHDLYIPPDALEIVLEAFEGPLDLLLYLIRKENLDILDIPMA